LQQFEFPPLENGGTVEDIRERAATRLFESLRYHSIRTKNPNSDDATDINDEDLCEKIADTIEEEMYKLSGKDVMSNVYKEKCLQLVSNFKRNFDLVNSIKTDRLPVLALLNKNAYDLATMDQKALRAKIIKDATIANLKVDELPWIPSKRERCPNCQQKTCLSIVLSSGTSQKDEIYGGNNEEKTLWKCSSCNKRWKDDDLHEF